MSELGPEARAILDEGRAGDDPTAADRARNRAAVMRAIAAGGAVGAASAVGAGGSGASGALAVGWKVLAGLVVVGAVGAGAAWTRDRAQARTPATAASAAASLAPVSPPAPAEVSPAAPPAPGPSAEPVAPPPRVAVAPSPRRSEPAAPPAPVARETPSVPAAPEDTLPAETQRLREAHGALQGGDPAKALALLDEQAAAGAQLREEREAARALALCQLGRVDEAKAAAARFLRDNPRSPLADRVRAACAAPSAR